MKGRKGANRSEGALLPPPLAAAVLASEIWVRAWAERAWRGRGEDSGHALLPKLLVRMGALAVAVLERKQPAGPICAMKAPRTTNCTQKH